MIALSQIFTSTLARFDTHKVDSLPDYFALNELLECLISQCVSVELLEINERDYYVVFPDLTHAQTKDARAYKFDTLREARAMLFALLECAF